jgi:high-affinity Fe2+/Pb2+ permease
MEEKDLTKKVFEELKKRGLYEQEDSLEDEDDDNEESDDNQSDDNQSDTNDDFSEMVCRLLHSQTQVHIFHLQTKSYSEHKALQGYYEGIDALVDGVIESYQGKYGIITNYKTYDMEQYSNGKKTIAYFTGLLKVIDEKRDCCEDSYIQNQIDTIQELINSTVYKLKFLK